MTSSGVSVVIPARDAERYLAETIESALKQTVTPAEIVVVDDGSTDRTAEIAGSFGSIVRVVGQPGSGVSVAINRGIAETSSPLLAMLDADDLWPAEKLEVQAAKLVALPQLDAVFGFARNFASPEMSDEEAAKIRFDPEPGPFRAKGTMLIRRAAFDRIGPFDTRWRVGDFVDWHARAEEAGFATEMVEEVVLLRRVHASNFTRVTRDAHIDYVRVAREALKRRRERAP